MSGSRVNRRRAQPSDVLRETDGNVSIEIEIGREPTIRVTLD